MLYFTSEIKDYYIIIIITFHAIHHNLQLYLRDLTHYANCPVFLTSGCFCFLGDRYKY